MSVSAPGPMDLIDGAAAILAGLASAAPVIPDPVYSEKQDDYLRLGLRTGDQFWLVGVTGEDPDEPQGVDGGAQFTTLELTAGCKVVADATGVPSRATFNTMIREARDAFRQAENRALGITTPGVTVRQTGIHAPDGIYPWTVDETVVHVGRFECRVFVSAC